ncbi:MAG: hypothetical protein PWP16_446 [Eubacteriaceae bacterium]|nr:hypothetical protein [Eubacteriaceae bacterium]
MKMCEVFKSISDVLRMCEVCKMCEDLKLKIKKETALNSGFLLLKMVTHGRLERPTP